MGRKKALSFLASLLSYCGHASPCLHRSPSQPLPSVEYGGRWVCFQLQRSVQLEGRRERKGQRERERGRDLCACHSGYGLGDVYGGVGRRMQSGTGGSVCVPVQVYLHLRVCRCVVYGHVGVHKGGRINEGCAGEEDAKARERERMQIQVYVQRVCPYHDLFLRFFWFFVCLRDSASSFVAVLNQVSLILLRVSVRCHTSFSVKRSSSLNSDLEGNQKERIHRRTLPSQATRCNSSDFFFLFSSPPRRLLPLLHHPSLSSPVLLFPLSPSCLFFVQMRKTMPVLIELRQKTLEQTEEIENLQHIRETLVSKVRNQQKERSFEKKYNRKGKLLAFFVPPLLSRLSQKIHAWKREYLW